MKAYSGRAQREARWATKSDLFHDPRAGSRRRLGAGAQPFPGVLSASRTIPRLSGAAIRGITFATPRQFRSRRKPG
jgi:hypothetical protein